MFFKTDLGFPETTRMVSYMKKRSRIRSPQHNMLEKDTNERSFRISSINGRGMVHLDLELQRPQESCRDTALEKGHSWSRNEGFLGVYDQLYLR